MLLKPCQQIYNRSLTTLPEHLAVAEEYLGYGANKLSNAAYHQDPVYPNLSKTPSQQVRRDTKKEVDQDTMYPNLSITPFDHIHTSTKRG